MNLFVYVDLGHMFFFMGKEEFKNLNYEQIMLGKYGLKLIGEEFINNRDILKFEVLDKKKASIFVIHFSDKIIYP